MDWSAGLPALLVTNLPFPCILNPEFRVFRHALYLLAMFSFLKGEGNRGIYVGSPKASVAPPDRSPRSRSTTGRTRHTEKSSFSRQSYMRGHGRAGRRENPLLLFVSRVSPEKLARPCSTSSTTGNTSKSTAHWAIIHM